MASGTELDKSFSGENFYSLLRNVGLRGARRAKIIGIDAAIDELDSYLTPEQECHLALAALSMGWCQCGFPLIKMSDKLAASYVCTKISKENLTHVDIPWRTFVVDIPDGLIKLPTKSGAESFVRSLFVGFNDASETRLTIFATAYNFNRVYGLPVEDLQSLCDVDGDPLATSLSRLIIGACIELSDPKHRTRVTSIRNSKAMTSPRGEPLSYVFTLCRPIVVDCRKEVLEYTSGRSGTKSAPQIQSLVRGHWKNQVHGPKNSLRKWIHVEPYWKGPEDAPIAVRPHVLQ